MSAWDWTGDAAVVSAAGSGSIDRRLGRLASRRGAQGLRGHAVVLAAALVGVVPWRVSAQEPTRPPVLAQQWEDVLLLDALRYLQLTPAQLQRALPLVHAAEDRMEKLAGEEARATAALDLIARRQREALVGGKPVSLKEQSEALAAEKRMREQREAAANDVTEQITPKLAEILTRDQIRRAFLLARGEMPRDVPRRPALLDPPSGFVVEPHRIIEARDRAIRQALSRAHPADLLDAYHSRPRFTDFFVLEAGPGGLKGELTLTPRPTPSLVVGQALDFTVRANPGEVVEVTPEPNAYSRFPEAARKGLERDEAELRRRWDKLSDLLMSAASRDELEGSLRPLVRRMFTSPRLRPVVEERLERAKG
jgi:hypothetical protein